MNLTIISKTEFNNKETVKSFISFLMEKFSVNEDEELNIVFTNDEEIQKLNKKFRKKDSPTNILSFYGYDGNILGDIVISIETLEKESKEQNVDILEYTLFIIVHGFLHLLGYTHETMEKFNNMISIQKHLVEEFISNKRVEK